MKLVNFVKLERAAVLVLATAMIGVGPVLAQQTTTQEHQSTTTTTSTTSANGYDADAPVPASAHQLKKDERADRRQAKADKAERKLAKSDKMHNAEKKQDEADRAAANANNPY
jgi:hypothetical protein